MFEKTELFRWKYSVSQEVISSEPETQCFSFPLHTTFVLGLVIEDVFVIAERNDEALSHLARLYAQTIHVTIADTFWL